jgi:site-specific recombinase XerD
VSDLVATAGPPSADDLQSWTAAYFAARRTAKSSPHTTAAYHRDLAAVTAMLTEVVGKPASKLEVADLTVHVIREAFGRFADTHSPASIHRCWSTWNQFFTFLVAEGALAGNPMPAVKLPKRPARSPKPLIGEDTPETLLRSAAHPRPNARNPWPERDLAVLATLLLTGLRSAELLGLTPASITGRPGERRIHVLGKGGKARTVPIEDSLYTVLEAYTASRRRRFPLQRVRQDGALFVDLRGQPLRRGGLQYLVATALRAAGVSANRSPGALVHALRHTFATRLAEDSATAGEIMALLGHGSLTTSQAYIDATAVEQRRSARANRTYQVLDILVERNEDVISAGP